MVIKKEIKKDVFADFHVEDNDRIVSNAAQLEAAESSAARCRAVLICSWLDLRGRGSVQLTHSMVPGRKRCWQRGHGSSSCGRNGTTAMSATGTSS